MVANLQLVQDNFFKDQCVLQNLETLILSISLTAILKNFKADFKQSEIAIYHIIVKIFERQILVIDDHSANVSSAIFSLRIDFLLNKYSIR